jgi:DNA-binding Lrp family transcriptional regulator
MKKSNPMSGQQENITESNLSQLVYILMVVKYGTKKLVSRELMELSQIEDIHELFGQYDIIVKMTGNNIKEIETFIQENIRSIPDIERTETLVVSDIAKEC